jgi:molybdate transport system substrate-binding protein
MRPRLWMTAGAGILLAVAATGCSPNAPANATTVTVGAAASLTDVFAQVGAAFTAAHPGIEVTFTFAGSSTLAEQIRQGAPIDVLASAGSSSMTPLADDGLVSDVTDFATNTLQIATPPANPGNVQSIRDLSAVTFVVCQEAVPCGIAAQELFARTGINPAAASYESDVRAVLTKVIADEVDAGIVYVTDVIAAGDDVAGVEIPAEANVSTTYQAAVTQDSASRQAAADFVAFLTSDLAQSILSDAGFGAP